MIHVLVLTMILGFAPTPCVPSPGHPCPPPPPNNGNFTSMALLALAGIVAVMLFLFDVGARISEVLSLCADAVDFDNLLVRLDGKGGKTRIVPFSAELRKRLVRYIADAPGNRFVFASRNGTKLGRRNVLRSVKQLCRKVGFEPPARTLHAARHSYASNYLRRGGNALALQRTLGHADLATTQRYCHLAVADLQAAHEQISLLR